MKRRKTIPNLPYNDDDIKRLRHEAIGEEQRTGSDSCKFRSSRSTKESKIERRSRIFEQNLNRRSR